MKEFFAELAALLIGFPPVLATIAASGAGSLAICIVMVIRGEIKGKGLSEVMGRFIAGWLGGAFLSPLFSPAITAVIKVPEVTVSFVAGGSGYWAMDKYLSKKQEELLNKKPPDDTAPPSP